MKRIEPKSPTVLKIKFLKGADEYGERTIQSNGCDRIAGSHLYEKNYYQIH
jgi:hypothetical protein